MLTTIDLHLLALLTHITQGFQKKIISERPRTELGLNCFKDLGPKFWSSVPETFKNLKRDSF